MHPEQLRALGRMINVVNPCDGKNPFGNCVACSKHVAKVLVRGGIFRWITDSEGDLSGAGEPEVRIAEDDDGDRAQRVWEWLDNWTVPGGVYLLSDEDHTFNILRDLNGQLHLIDSNLQVYRTLNRLKDCEVLFQNPHTGKCKLINHLGPGEGRMEIYYFGLLHINFQGVGTQGRWRRNSTGSNAY
jgi:hypothetical protein